MDNSAAFRCCASKQSPAPDAAAAGWRPRVATSWSTPSSSQAAARRPSEWALTVTPELTAKTGESTVVVARFWDCSQGWRCSSLCFVQATLMTQLICEWTVQLSVYSVSSPHSFQSSSHFTMKRWCACVSPVLFHLWFDATETTGRISWMTALPMMSSVRRMGPCEAWWAGVVGVSTGCRTRCHRQERCAGSHRCRIGPGGARWMPGRWAKAACNRQHSQVARYGATKTVCTSTSTSHHPSQLPLATVVGCCLPWSTSTVDRSVAARLMATTALRWLRSGAS